MEHNVEGEARELMGIEDALFAQMRQEFRERLERRLQDAVTTKELQIPEAQGLTLHAAILVHESATLAQRAGKKVAERNNHAAAR